MNNTKIYNFKVLAAIFLFIISNSAFAGIFSSSHNEKSSDYYTDYYEDEGDLLFKIRGFYASTDSKLKSLPVNINSSTSKKLADHGYGFNSSVSIFITENIAADISLGIGFYKTKSAVLSAIAAAYGSSGTGTGKKDQIFMGPVALTAQYHIAPFGAIRPYVGAGIHGTYMYTRSKVMKIASNFGPVFQGGIDFFAKDDTIFTFDIKQYFLKSKITLKNTFLGTNNDVKPSITWNPLIISVGIGFKL